MRLFVLFLLINIPTICFSQQYKIYKVVKDYLNIDSIYFYSFDTVLNSYKRFKTVPTNYQIQAANKAKLQLHDTIDVYIYEIYDLNENIYQKALRQGECFVGFDSIFWSKGRLSYVGEWYRDTAKTLTSGKYCNSVMIGTWKRFREDGKLLEIEIYNKEGTLINRELK